MEFEKNDQAIYIKDLLFAVLKQWRKALVVALLLAVVFGAYKGYSLLQAKNAQPDAAALEQYTKQKSQQEADIAQLEQSILSQKKYMDTAVFMQMNAYEVYTSNAVLYVKTPYEILPGMTYQNPDNTAYVISAIWKILVEEDVTQAIAQEVGYDNFAELVNIYSEGTFLVITATHSEEAAATALVDAYLNQLPQASASVKNTVGEHSYTVVSRTCNKTASTELSNKQTEQQQRLKDLETKLAEAQAKLAALPAPAAAVPVTNADICKGVLIFAIVGAVGGVFLVALLACLQHITGSKVYSARMLEQMTGIGVLGAFPTRKKPCKGIDRLLKKLEHRQLDDSQAVTAAILANLSNYCPAGGKLLIAGACDRADMDFIVRLVTEAGYVVLAAGNLRTDADAVIALSQCDGLLLAEACGISLYPEVERSAVLAKNLGKPVAGCILIDG